MDPRVMGLEQGLEPCLWTSLGMFHPLRKFKFKVVNKVLWVPLHQFTFSGNMPVQNGSVSQAPDGEGCPRCGGYVYHADQIFSKGRAWHKECFKCSTCHRVLDSRIACDGPDSDVYCTGANSPKLYSIIFINNHDF